MMDHARYTPEDIRNHSLWFYGVTLTSIQVDELFAKYHKLGKNGGGWAGKKLNGTTAGLAIWLKSRLYEQGAFDVVHHPPDDLHTACEMHVFFIHLEETKQMMARLKSDAEAKRDTIARSRMHKYMQANEVAPIDKTAFIVAPPPSSRN